MMGDPWDRREGEPYNWWTRFDKHYRPQGEERTLEEAWRLWKAEWAPSGRSKRPHPSWYKQSSEWCWKGRARAWDGVQRQKRLEVERAEQAAMLQRHKEFGRALQIVGGMTQVALRQLLQAMLEEKKPLEVLSLLSPNEARQYVKDGISLELTASGLPVELIAIWGMTDDELIQYYRDILAGQSQAEAGGGDADRAEGLGPEDGDGV